MSLENNLLFDRISGTRTEVAVLRSYGLVALSRPRLFGSNEEAELQNEWLIITDLNCVLTIQPVEVLQPLKGVESL